MGSGSTSRLALPYPVGTDPNNVPADLLALASRLDTIDATLTGVETLTNKTLTGPVINGGVLDAASSIGGVSGSALAAARGAWTDISGTLALANITSGNYTLSAAQLLDGKRCIVVLHAAINNASTSIVNLAGLQPYAHGNRMLGSALYYRGGLWQTGAVLGNGPSGATTAVFPLVSGNNSQGYIGGTGNGAASGDTIDAILVYETT